MAEQFFVFKQAHYHCGFSSADCAAHFDVIRIANKRDLPSERPFFQSLRRADEHRIALFDPHARGEELQHHALARQLESLLATRQSQSRLAGAVTDQPDILSPGSADTAGFVTVTFERVDDVLLGQSATLRSGFTAAIFFARKLADVVVERKARRFIFGL